MSKKENLTRILLCVSIITLLLCNIPSYGIASVEKSYTTYVDTVKRFNVAYDKYTVDSVKAENTVKHELDSIKQQLIDEVHKYIIKGAPNYTKTIAHYMVDNAIAGNIDLCFMISQTQIETNFGTAGIGRSNRRKSIFGVMRTYSSYEACVKDYVALLNKSYLGKGRTEQTLMRNYVTHGGSRYASDRGYEKKLSENYRNIKKKTNIYTLQQRYKELD